MMKYKAAQIIPYFGKWPEWIELYFYSCGRNPMVDFIFYTDCPLPEHRYKNTIFHSCSYTEYCELVSSRLQIEYKCAKPYKLTDLKPFIGTIHEEELTDYDFWGMGDLDLVYGDLGMVINESNLEKYDVLTTHNYHLAGHCCFFRNNDYYRNLCFKIKDWREKITSETPMSLDELEFTYIVCPLFQTIGRIHKYLCRPLGIHYFKVLDTLNPLFHKKVLLHEYGTSPEPQNGGGTWRYDKNRVWDDKGRELPYLHFLFFKKTPWLKTDVYWHDGFYKIHEPIENCKYIDINIEGIFAR